MLNSDRTERMYSNAKMQEAAYSNLNQRIPALGMKRLMSLPELESSIMQHILTLREDKITIMQERNIIIDRKNDIERELAKFRKKAQRESE